MSQLSVYLYLLIYKNVDQQQSNLDVISIINLNEVVKKVKPVLKELLTKKLQIEKEISQKVRGKYLIMIIGETGTWKSTLCNSILGNQIKVRKDKKKIVLQSKGKGPKIGCSIQSQTSQLQFFQIGNNAILIDSPGFCDTRGYQIDILNCQSIKAVFTYSKAIKAVWTLDRVYFEEPKKPRIRKLIKNMSLSFGKYDKHSVVLVVTNANSEWNPQKVREEIQCVFDQLTQLPGTQIAKQEKALYKFLIKECPIFVRKIKQIQIGRNPDQVLRQLKFQIKEQGFDIQIDGNTYSIAQYASKYSRVIVLKAQIYTITVGVAVAAAAGICQVLALFSGPVGWGILGLVTLGAGTLGGFKVGSSICSVISPKFQQYIEKLQRKRQAKKQIRDLSSKIQTCIKANQTSSGEIRQLIQFCQNLVKD